VVNIVGTDGQDDRNRWSVWSVLYTKLKEVEKNIKTAKESYWIKKEMDKGTYDEFMTDYTEQKEEILGAMPNYSLSISNLENDLREALTFSSKLATVWTSSSVGLKEKIQKLVFPSGIVYDTKQDVFLTLKVNRVFLAQSYQLRLSDNEQNTKGDDKSPFVHNAEREGFAAAICSGCKCLIINAPHLLQYAFFLFLFRVLFRVFVFLIPL